MASGLSQERLAVVGLKELVGVLTPVREQLTAGVRVRVVVAEPVVALIGVSVYLNAGGTQ